MSFLQSANPITGFPLLEEISRKTDTLHAMSQISRLLQPTQLSPQAIAGWLRNMGKEELDFICARSAERASHFKWFLGSTSNRYIVWLHEYKPTMPPPVAGSYAASVHNHRYSFVSRVLSGSLSVSEFALDKSGANPRFVESRRITAGYVYTLTSDEVHRIDRTDTNTCTLLVQAPAERSCSRVFDLESGSYQEIYDLSSRLLTLVSVLSQ
jgi:hypothetical protein